MKGRRIGRKEWRKERGREEEGRQVEEGKEGEEWKRVGKEWKKETICTREHMEKLESLFTVGRNVQWYSCCEKQHSSSSKFTNRTTTWPCISSSKYVPERAESRILKSYLHTCIHHIHYSQYHDSRGSRGGTNPVVHRRTNRQRKRGIQIQCNMIQPLK